MDCGGEKSGRADFHVDLSRFSLIADHCAKTSNDLSKHALGSFTRKEQDRLLMQKAQLLDCSTLSVQTGSSYNIVASSAEQNAISLPVS